MSNGVVFIGSYDCDLYAINASTGAEVWNYTTAYLYQSPFAIGSSPAVSDGVLYVGTQDSSPYAQNSPLPSGGNAYRLNAQPSNDGVFYALNASTGAEVWSYTTSGSDYSSPAVSGGVVYLAGSDGHIYAFGESPIPVPEFPDSLVFFTVLVGVLIAVVCERSLRSERIPA